MFLSITNNVMLSVYERYREIGTLRAIGTNRFSITLQFFYESVFLGILGWMLAVILSVILVNIIENFGIVMPPAPGRTYSYPLSFRIKNIYNFYVLIVCTVSAIIGGLIPAAKASNIKIIEAIRYV